ncbi:MAG: hypothetical protein WCY11_05625 [Novosphingobium sp.]
MQEAKPFASLSPSLLARKGSARPAMRPQLQPMHQFHAATARQLDEDLGWNDMGHDIHAPGQEVESLSVGFADTPPALAMMASEVVPIAPAVSVDLAAVSPPVPEVVRQRAEVAERVAAIVGPLAVVAPVIAVAPVQPEAWKTEAPEMEAAGREAVRPEPVMAAAKAPTRRRATTSARRSALSEGRRAAFTLRLDVDRHLKLKLAATVVGRSAQQVVTEALDAFLANVSELDALAAQVRKRS